MGTKASPPELFSEDDAGIIVLTSGTTGTPKGVMLPCRALESLAEYLETLRMEVPPVTTTAQEGIVYFGSASWVSFTFNLLQSLRLGMLLALGTRYEKGRYFEALRAV